MVDVVFSLFVAPVYIFISLSNSVAVLPWQAHQRPSAPHAGVAGRGGEGRQEGGGPNSNRLSQPDETLRLRLPTLKIDLFFQSLGNPLELHGYTDQTAENQTSKNEEYNKSGFACHLCNSDCQGVRPTSTRLRLEVHGPILSEAILRPARHAANRQPRPDRHRRAKARKGPGTHKPLHRTTTSQHRLHQNRANLGLLRHHHLCRRPSIRESYRNFGTTF